MTLRRRFALALVVAASLAGGALLAMASGGRAASTATCTYEQKQARTAALKKAKASIARQRAAFFKAHKSRKARAAFVKQQSKRLKRLRAAAACTVPPLPPSSDASCSFMLAPNEDSERDEARNGYPYIHEGPIKPDGHLRSLGDVRGIVLMVDFPDVAAEGPPSVGRAFLPESAYFDDVSYGRFRVAGDVADRWFRMPRTTATYEALPIENNGTYIRDAVAAADPYVDFSRYDFVVVVATRQWLRSGNSAWFVFPGHGASNAEREIRVGTTYTQDIARFGSRVINHEFMHALGLPDLYSDNSTSTWDPMANASDGQVASTHPLGWHKWRLGWLDPPQLTCLTAPGQLDETLTANAKPGGKKLVVVPTNASETYVIEARVRIGHDAGICEEGVLVSYVDSQVTNGRTRNGHGPLHIKGPLRCVHDGAGALHTGEVYEDGTIKVEVLARNATAFRVRVTRK